MKKNNTFCILPRISLTVNVNGKIRICCATSYTLTDLNFGYNKISEIWNSNELNEIREDLLDGKKIKYCESCQFSESLGQKSNRLIFNQKWKNIDKEQPPKIIDLDLKLSNVCNLKCRMCSPYCSNLLAKEYNKFNHSYKNIPISYTEILSTWNQTDIFWENIKEILPHLSRLKFTGGEPSIDKNVLKILEYCILNGYNKHIELRLVINGTNINEKFRNLISQFYKLHLDISVDAVGKMGEYIRHPSKWDNINKNLITASKLPNITMLGISTTMQVLNIYSFVDLFDWYKNLNHIIVDKYKINISFGFVINPSSYNIKNLPDEILNTALDKLKKLPYHTSYDTQYIQTMNILKNIDRRNDKNTNAFFELNNYYDSIRNQSLKNVNLELYEDLMRYKTDE